MDDFRIPPRYGLFIGNEWIEPASSAVLESVSPLTGEVLCTVPDANEEDVARAVMAARAAWPGWSRSGPRKRQQAMLAVADRLVAEAERFAWLETSDTGKPWRESYANVLVAADRLRYFAGAARAFEGRTLPAGGDILSLDFREPLGVVGILGAWNFPLNMFAGKVAPAIAVGNAVVYKPGEPTPLTTLELARIMGEVLPPGVVNVVTGNGDTTGAAIVGHPDVRKVSITGAVETGRLVAAAAARTTKQVTLELGGKNAQLVYPDADLDHAAQGIMLGAFMNQGQVCTSGSRIFAHRSIAAELGRRIVDLIPRLRVGDPFDKATTMGTMVYAEHLDKVMSMIDLGRAEGAELIAGGHRLEVADFPRGLFVEPTLFTGATPDMQIAREEVFGPVATLHEWDDEDELFGAVNGLDYGLAAGIWTENLGRAHRAARRVEAGRVWINCYNLFPSGASFGGTKASGYGREDAFETMLAFTQVKNVIVDIAEERRKFYE